MHSVVVGCLEVENGESHFFWFQIVLIAWGVKGNIHLLAITTLCLDLMGDSPLLLTSSYYVGNSFLSHLFFFPFCMHSILDACMNHLLCTKCLF